MKKTCLFVFLLIYAALSDAQGVCGNFIHDFYYIDPVLITEKKISRIRIVVKDRHGKMVKTVYFNAGGRKIRYEIRAVKEQSYTLLFDSTDICDFTCPLNSTMVTECNQNGLLLSGRDSINGIIHTLGYDSLGRPLRENWQYADGFMLHRLFFYNSQNQLDSVFVRTFQDSFSMGTEYYKYHYFKNRLAYVEQFIHAGYGAGKPLFLSVSIIGCLYNKSGLTGKIKVYGREKGKIKISYYSGKIKLK